MKLKTLLFLFICLSLNACKDDDNEPGGNGNRPETQAWIEDTMREHYFWYNEIPASEKLNYANEPEAFFKSLLSNKDGKDYIDSKGELRHQYFSYIEELSDGNTRSSINESYSYGFEFSSLYSGNANERYVIVLYVLSGSPADEAGLTRGDWIMKINDAAVTDTNIASLLGNGACSLTIAKWDPESKKLVVQSKKIDMPSARQVEDDPVYTWNIVESPVQKKRVGYLLYNHFTTGKSDEDTSYDDHLRTLSDSYFKGVNEFVLDLRYNNGGILSSGILLCTILQPENRVGSKLGHLQYNDKQKNRTRDFYTSKEVLGSTGKNLKLETLYVLVSSSTASASEMVINSLRPFMNVVVIGETTVGKNVGSLEYTSNDKKWEMHPIVCQIYNSANFTNYADGIEPDVELDERGEIVKPNTIAIGQIFPLGDPNERLFKAAIDLIDGTTTISRSLNTPTVTYKKAPFNSIDRKATGSVVINK